MAMAHRRHDLLHDEPQARPRESGTGEITPGARGVPASTVFTADALFRRLGAHGADLESDSRFAANGAVVAYDVAGFTLAEGSASSSSSSPTST